jgi:hypothetical protein
LRSKELLGKEMDCTKMPFGYFASNNHIVIITRRKGFVKQSKCLI